MIKLADYRTEDAFPSEMKTASRCAAAYAFDQEKKRILEAKKRVLIWAWKMYQTTNWTSWQ